MSEIVAVISDECSNDMDDMVKRLKEAGVDVTNVNANEGVVEGTVEASKTKMIDDLPGVDYVRTVFTYAANFCKVESSGAAKSATNGSGGKSSSSGSSASALRATAGV